MKRSNISWSLLDARELHGRDENMLSLLDEPVGTQITIYVSSRELHMMINSHGCSVLIQTQSRQQMFTI